MLKETGFISVISYNDLQTTMTWSDMKYNMQNIHSHKHLNITMKYVTTIVKLQKYQLKHLGNEVNDE